MDPREDRLDIAGICLPFLRESQNPDGGWGYRPGNSSRVEATCWGLLGLCESSRDLAEDRVRVQNGRDFLQTAQLSEGSWPATAGEETGCWVTSLCCLALEATENRTSSHTIDTGLRWICNDWPSDSTPWRRFLMRLSSQRDVAPINHSYRGWGWTPGTSSWVEPTSFALMALELCEARELAGKAKRRRKLAISLLFDRMCPGGGWNAGNPMVYGVAGVASVVPTVWALLALRRLPGGPAITLSLDWLESAAGTIQSPGSLALAQICLKAHGRSWPSATRIENGFLQNSDFLENVVVAAWALLASESDFWLGKPNARTVAA